mmetsp:Transcript_40481/g.77737  ORF Transcript_40481/g.77737 Transcript_40481/m.77737 type:complete len:97 (-) Transcript_40481:79-369(-)
MCHSGKNRIMESIDVLIPCSVSGICCLCWVGCYWNLWEEVSCRTDHMHATPRGEGLPVDPGAIEHLLKSQPQIRGHVKNVHTRSPTLLQKPTAHWI